MSNAPANPNNPYILEAYDIKKDFDHPAGRLSVLKGVHFKLSAGEMVFILGRSGSGKSSLMHLLGGLDQPTSGKIIFEGQDLTEMNEKTLARVRNRRVGFVFQFYHLLPELTLYENVLLPSMIAGKPDEKWAKDLLKRVKLWSRQDHYPSELAGGENSGPRSRARLSTVPRSCFAMNRPETSTVKPRSRSFR